MAAGGKSDIKTVPLYSGILPVSVRLGTLEYGERRLRIEVDRKQGPNLSPLEVQLVDDADPCFLYTLKLTGEDFLMMKKQQGLLVDFELFPEHLINLLNKCSDGKSNFQLVLIKEDGSLPSARTSSLQVIESTNFRNLCYLTLLLAESSDLDVKNHLRKKVADLQEIIRCLENKVDSMAKELKETAREINLNEQEFLRIKAKYEEEKRAIKAQADRELTEEKDKHSKVIWEYQQSAELDKKCLEDKFQDIIRQQEKQIASLKNQLQTSLDLQRKLEYTNREHAKEIEVLEKENKICKGDTASLKKQIFKLDSDYHDKEREVQTLRTRLAVLEQELKDKNELLAELQESAKYQLEEKKQNEEAMVEKENMIQRQKMSLENLSEDLLRANALLSLHQREVLSLKSKLKMSTNVAFEQEKLLEGKTKGITELRELYGQSKRKVQELEEEVEKLKESMLQMEQSILDKEKLLHEDKIVIDRLNLRLRELYVQEPPQSLTHWSYKSRCPLKFMTPESASTPMSGSIPFSRQNPTQPIFGCRAPQAYLPVRARGPLPQGFSRATNATTSGTGSLDPITKSDLGDGRKDPVMQECKDKAASEDNKEKSKPEDKLNSKGPKEASLPHVGILRVNPPPRPSAYFNPAGRK